MIDRRRRFLVADDHAVARAGVRQILGEKFSAEFLEAENAHTALEIVRRENLDTIVLDVSLPGRSGLDILPEIKVHQPQTPVLVLSMYSEEQFAARALRAGASGYVAKTSMPEELVRAVETTRSGGRYVSAQFAQQLAAALESGGVSSCADPLSTREFEVLRMLAKGMSGKEIAAELSLSFKTVSTHRTRILQKLHLGNNAQIIRYALDHGLIE